MLSAVFVNGTMTGPLVPAAPVAPDVDGEVRDVVVGGARIERVQAAPADDVPLDLAHDDRVAGPARLEPAPALLGRARLRLERGQAILDPLIVDRGNRAGVGRHGGADGHVAHTPSLPRRMRFVK